MMEPMTLWWSQSLFDEVVGDKTSKGTGRLPEDRTDLDRRLATPLVRDDARDQSTEPGTAGHGGSDATLHCIRGTQALALDVEATLVELAQIRLSGDDGRHG